MKIYFLPLIFHLCCADIISAIDTIHHVAHKKLKIFPNSSNSWDLSALYTSETTVNEMEAKKISSLQLEGLSPCIVNDPSLMLSVSFFHTDELDILDFTTVDTSLYYTTEKGVYRVQVHDRNMSEHLVKVASVGKEQYEFIEGFKLPASKVLLILKGKIKFTYVIVENQGIAESEVKSIDDSFEEFSEDMKLTMIGDFLLIPAKNKGLYLYRYNAESNLLEHAKTFLEGKNVRDITAKPGPITNKIAGYLCDPDKGIASYEIDIKTMEMRQSDYMKEFIGAKVVNWILYEGDNKLFTVLEGLRNSAKAIILSINLKNLTDMTYDSIKLVDGSPRYGNAGNQYTSVIMANSIFLMETNKKGDSMYRYFNIEGINHAKIYNRNSESLSLIHICRCRRYAVCRSRWSPYH
eukprot:TRINITY_DN7201_c0_g1_i15.p1 TRINITY_DN7201_c0_g1~~TRINITY_DN7201_c0_g1_i15.p1  ORF type:complete len:407 (-),score=89.65 TRINITY_DN7201_c0_g1_i15:22-1242(-)